MTEKKKPYDVLLIEEYGETNDRKARFYNIGTAFETDKGGMSVLIPEGISITGGRRISIVPRTDKPEAP
jgi:hypothetical protein